MSYTISISGDVEMWVYDNHPSLEDQEQEDLIEYIMDEMDADCQALVQYYCEIAVPGNIKEKVNEILKERDG